MQQQLAASTASPAGALTCASTSARVDSAARRPLVKKRCADSTGSARSGATAASPHAACVGEAGPRPLSGSKKVGGGTTAVLLPSSLIHLLALSHPPTLRWRFRFLAALITAM